MRTSQYSERRDLVVELLAALVEAPQVLRQRLLEKRRVDPRGAGIHQDLDGVQQPPRIAVGEADEAGLGIFIEFYLGARKQLRQVVRIKRFQNINCGARQQSAIHLERGVLGRGADEREQATLDVGKKRVLLRLVEAVHLVDEEDGAPAARCKRVLGFLHRLADVLDAGEHGRERDELGVESLRHEPGDGGLARARRTPQDHGVRLARFEGEPQRLAGTDEMALPYDLVERLRAKRVG
jgi:hypothetical protein